MTLKDTITSQLAEKPSGLERNALFLALLSTEMKERGYRPPVAVGGFAVEAYTFGRVMSFDIDLIGNRDGLTPILNELGFSSLDGRNWLHNDLEIYVDIQGGSINIPGGDTRVEDVEVFAGCTVKMVSMTDIVADRISAYASGHKDSAMQASIILSVWREHIDLGVLRDICRQENAVAECEEVIKRSMHPPL
jgi:hypothetical protein